MESTNDPIIFSDYTQINEVPLRVLFCSPFLNFPGHIRRITTLKARSMAEAGLDVTVFGFPLTFDDIEPHERLRYVSLQAGFSARCRDRLAACSRWFGNFWLFLVEVGWVQWVALRYARRHSMEIIYIADIEPWLLIMALWLTKSRRQRLPLVGTISFLFNVKTSNQPWFSRLRSRLNYHAALQLPRWMDVVFDSAYWAEPYRKVSARVYVIPDGYECSPMTISRNEARDKLGIPGKACVLLHFGIATPGKGTDILVAALQGVPPSFDLYIVGKSVIYSRKGLLDNLPSEWRPHVHLESRYVTEEERIQYFSACDAVIVPYRYGFTGASCSFRDAISFGKAILVSDQFLMGKMMRNYDLGLLFKPDNVEDLRRALIEFSQKPEGWFQGIAEGGKGIVEEFSWRKVGLRYRELFERLVAEGGGRRAEDGPSYAKARWRASDGLPSVALGAKAGRRPWVHSPRSTV